MSIVEKPGNQRFGLRGFVLLFIGVVVIVVGSGYTIQKKLHDRNVAKARVRSAQNLRFLALAVQLYHDTYGCFPPAVVKDSNGEPLYSGRVLLLPFLEQQQLYDAFRKKVSWDSYANLKFLNETPLFMHDESMPAKVSGQTDYLFVVGKGTIFEPPVTGSTASSMTDGISNTICIVEVKDSRIKWSEPRDLDLSKPIALPPGNYRGVNLAVYFDTHLAVIRNGVPPNVLRAAATCAGGEPSSAIAPDGIDHISP
jgi:Protein of unknown function (DUF1559)